MDRHGRFCWSGGLLVVMPRQLGKSTLMAMLALWLAEQEGRVVVSAADTLRTMDRVMAPWRRWAMEQEYRATSRLDQPQIWFQKGQWVGQAANEHLGVGMTVDAGLVDEAWDVPEVAVTRALAPAMSAVESPLLLLTSTASVGVSPLMERYRQAAENGARNVGLIEWAASPDADLTSENTWRQAHPYWSPQRLDYLRQQYEVLPTEDFQSQYLCIPQVRSMTGPTPVPLAAADKIHEARRRNVQPVGHVVGGIEDWHGQHTGAALCWKDPDTGHPVVVGKRFDNLDAGFAWLGQWANEVLVGLTYRDHPQAQLMSAKGVGSRETNKALPLLRRLFNQDQIGWDGDDLGDQLTELGVAERDGLLKPVAGASYLIRPAAWAVLQQTTAPAVAGNVF